MTLIAHTSRRVHAKRAGRWQLRRWGLLRQQREGTERAVTGVTLVSGERFKNGLLCVLFAAAAVSASVALGSPAIPPTQEVGGPLARFSLLKPATRIYLRYKIKDGQRQTVDLWRRQVSFDEHDGQRRLHIFWRWDSVGDRKFNRTEDFWFEMGTFRPLTVERRLEMDGKVTVRGYRYLPDKIESMAELSGEATFLQLAKMPAYNWETDMELLQALPLATHYDVRIPFYEAGPGQEEPQYYEYRVTGEDVIKSADGHSIACWVVRVESTDPSAGPTRFWFAKDTQVMIREQTTLKNGTIFVKMLLPYDSGDEASWNREPSPASSAATHS